MASYRKKRHVETDTDSTAQLEEPSVQSNSESDDEESSGDDSEIEGEAMDAEIHEEVQVDFEAFPPGQGDFHGIKTLLQQLFLKSNVHFGGVTDLILSQNHIGCVVKQSEAQLAEESDSDDEIDDNVYGVTSVISLTDNQDTPCITQIRNLLFTKCNECADSGSSAEFQRLLEKNRVGLLISERFLNIPPQLAPPLHLSLHKDLTRAKAKQEQYNFDYFVLMCKSYETMKHGKKKKKKNDSKLDQEVQNFFFANAEDEIFQQESILSFKYSIMEETDSAIGGSWAMDETQLKTFRTILVVPASRMDNILKDIQSNLAS